MASSNMANTEKNLWVDILVDVQSSSQVKLPTSKSLLVLGDNESGKTTLVAKLQGGGGEVKKGSGLEFLYINVKDEYRDDQSRLGAWILDGDLDYRALLRYALTEHSYAHTTVVLVASLARPWDLIDALQRWVEVLEAHTRRLRLASDLRAKQEATLLREYQSYVYPDDPSLPLASRRLAPSGGPLSPDAPGGGVGGDEGFLPLGPGTLTNNLGIPIIVVLTQSDAVATVEKDFDYRDEQWDFIQLHVRLFCLRYGASLVYTSVKENKNVDLLGRYLVHRIYGLPFNSPACVVEKDAVFIPAGWDNDKKIAILQETSLCVRHPGAEFSDVIIRPITRKALHRDAEALTDDDQVFLLKVQSTLNSLPTAPSSSISIHQVVSSFVVLRILYLAGTPVRSFPTTKTLPPNQTLSGVRVSPAAAPPSTKVTAEPPKTENEALTTFFKTLLTKKVVPTPAENSTASSSGEQADLSRATQAKASPPRSSASTPAPAFPANLQNNGTPPKSNGAA